MRFVIERHIYVCYLKKQLTLFCQRKFKINVDLSLCLRNFSCGMKQHCMMFQVQFSFTPSDARFKLQSTVFQIFLFHYSSANISCKVITLKSSQTNKTRTSTISYYEDHVHSVSHSYLAPSTTLFFSNITSWATLYELVYVKLSIFLDRRNVIYMISYYRIFIAS